jgi:hypothetical protein
MLYLNEKVFKRGRGMNDTNFEDFLRQQLQGSSHYLPDGDFSAKVMAGLPEPRRLSRWLEVLIVGVPVTVIALMVMSQFSLRDVIQPVYAWMLTMDMAGLMSLGASAVFAMLAAPLLLLFRQRSLF